jgi:acetyltransferase EpsM
VIGDHALIGPTASLCGGVDIGEGVLLGAGSSVTPRTRVGEWSVVGAGAAVVSDLPARSVCVGVPARAVRGIET